MGIELISGKTLVDETSVSPLTEAYGKARCDYGVNRGVEIFEMAIDIYRTEADRDATRRPVLTFRRRATGNESLCRTHFPVITSAATGLPVSEWLAFCTYNYFNAAPAGNDLFVAADWTQVGD